MSKDKIVDLLRKLQSLADVTRNNSVAEAEVAAARMHALMTEHKISMLELDADANEAVIELNIIAGAKRVMTWKSQLCHALCAVHHCQCLVGSAKLLIVGVESDVHAVWYLYRYLVKEINKIASKTSGPAHSSRQRFMNSFRLGCVCVIEERLKAQKNDAFAAMKGSTQAMVCAEDARVNTYLKVTYPFIKTQRRRYTYNSDGHAAGRKAGAGITLHGGPGLKAPAPRLEDK